MTSRRERKQVLLRLDPAVYEALARWAADELRSANSQIEFLLRRALADAHRMPSTPGPLPRRGRPPKDASPPEGARGAGHGQGRERGQGDERGQERGGGEGPAAGPASAGT
ncbi:hypothetical protein [Streptomyces sp. TRM64462]|uniref:hypothetical protein n=1 Tax=Streptomyces sp. TRM64462 TaxID=2741726 RepID=UPI0020C78D5B|nr:hypothetical protein [Streptomyces sp. TRM64462]